MTIPEGATKAAREFARAVVRKKWAEITPLLSAKAQARITPDVLAAEFGWKELGPRLRQEFMEATGESEDMVPELDPPKRFEIFEVEEREAPPNHDPQVPLGWVEVDFQPSEESEFDVCYNCFLAFIDEGGPKIANYAIELASE